MTPQKAVERNRRDHILPRGYLEGFTNPSKLGQLSVFSIERRNWFEANTSNVAAARGFYDYSEGSSPDATADQAFADFETRFPELRRDLVASHFSAWTKHLDFLVRYSQMLRARSEFFREEVLKQVQTASILRVDEVLETRPSLVTPGAVDIRVKYSQFAPENNPHRDAMFKNMSITKMRTEIAKGAGEFAGWHWCLRFTTDAAAPVITGDNAVALVGSGPLSRETALTHADTIFVFPVCWQACLIGSSRKFDTETEAIHPSLLAELHRLYLNEAGCRFAYSPTRLASG